MLAGTCTMKKCVLTHNLLVGSLCGVNMTNSCAPPLPASSSSLTLTALHMHRPFRGLAWTKCMTPMQHSWQTCPIVLGAQTEPVLFPHQTLASNHMKLVTTLPRTFPLLHLLYFPPLVFGPLKTHPRSSASGVACLGTQCPTALQPPLAAPNGQLSLGGGTSCQGNPQALWRLHNHMG